MANEQIHVPQNAQSRAVEQAGSGIQKFSDESTALVRPGFDSLAGFNLLQRQAAMFAASEIVPSSFRGKLADCAIVCEVAARGGISPLFAFQNLYVVKGKPRWSGKACIAIVNRSGLFDPLSFEWSGERGTDTWGCTAFAKRKSDGRMLRSALVDMKLVKAEGWFSNKDKDGIERSKWQTLPEQMFMYRTASMFLDVHYPEGLSGLPVEDGSEVVDMPPTRELPVEQVAPTPAAAPPAGPVVDPPPPLKPLQVEDASAKPTPPAEEPAPKSPARRGPAAVKEALAKEATEQKTEPVKQVTHHELVAWFKDDPARKVGDAILFFCIGRAMAATAFNVANDPGPDAPEPGVEG
jgi:hypothetical protein